MSRQDKRSLQQFKKDIKEGTENQRLILDAWLKTTNQSDLKWWDNGVDNDGAYIKNDRDVTLEADYCIERIGLVEVQYAKPLCPKFFHIKENKLKKCIQGQVKILMVNGWREEVPQFIMINVPQAKVIAARCEVVKWASSGFKAAYRVPIDLFQWGDLKK